MMSVFFSRFSFNAFLFFFIFESFFLYSSIKESFLFFKASRFEKIFLSLVSRPIKFPYSLYCLLFKIKSFPEYAPRLSTILHPSSSFISIASFKLSTIRSEPSRYSAKDLIFIPVFTISDALKIFIPTFGIFNKLVLKTEDSFRGIIDKSPIFFCEAILIVLIAFSLLSEIKQCDKSPSPDSKASLYSSSISNISATVPSIPSNNIGFSNT